MVRLYCLSPLQLLLHSKWQEQPVTTESVTTESVTMESVSTELVTTESVTTEISNYGFHSYGSHRYSQVAMFKKGQSRKCLCSRAVHSRETLTHYANLPLILFSLLNLEGHLGYFAKIRESQNW